MSSLVGALLYSVTMTARFSRSLLAALVLATSCWSSHGLAQVPPPPTSLTKATGANAPDWKDETTFEFGIYDASSTRIATAYYRIQREELQGRKVYRLKYNGKNPQMSESSECVVDAETLLPLRSTRKVVSTSRTFYQDVAYTPGKIIVRKKYEGEQAKTIEYPADPSYFDYESLIWIIPQLEFDAEGHARINLFDTLNEIATTALITDAGTAETVLNGEAASAHLYSFNVSMTPYKYWGVEMNGVMFPVRIDMDKLSYINLRYKSGKELK